MKKEKGASAPFFSMMKRKKPYTQLVYLSKLSLEEGKQLIEGITKNSPPLFIEGERVRRASEFQRFAVLSQGPLKCFDCGREATHFMIEKHKHEEAFHINVYAGHRMLTWDHIIPRSLGGSNHHHNGRVACNVCNEQRGNKMDIKELLWAMRQDPNIVYKHGPQKKRHVVMSHKRFQGLLNNLRSNPNFPLHINNL